MFHLFILVSSNFWGKNVLGRLFVVVDVFLRKRMSIPVLHNVALKKNATQSSVRNGGEAGYAVDGFGAVLFDTPNNNRTETNPDPDTGETWWRVDLQGLFRIHYIVITSDESRYIFVEDDSVACSLFTCSLVLKSANTEGP